MTPEKVEELPMEHTNGGLDTFTSSELNSVIHKFNFLNEGSNKMEEMLQLYGNENEDSQLIISDLESIGSIIKNKISKSSAGSNIN